MPLLMEHAGLDDIESGIGVLIDETKQLEFAFKIVWFKWINTCISDNFNDIFAHLEVKESH